MTGVQTCALPIYQVIEIAGGGTDTILSSIIFDLSAHGANVENLTLQGSANLGQGNSLDNVLTAGNVATSLFGNDGNDTLTGGDKADLLSGGKGDDVLIGGLGADALTGGDGHDDFVYLLDDTSKLAQLGGDTISDFTIGQDVIDLHDLLIDFNINAASAFSGGFVSLQASGNDTLVRFDKDGGGNNFLVLATVQNNNQVTASSLSL